MFFELHNINYHVGGREIVSGLDLSLGNGQQLLLLGPSGCGKSTLMNLMAGLLRQTSGEIIFKGRSYSDLSGAELDRLRAENFGFVFQKLHLIGHLSVAANISLAQPVKDMARVKELIADLRLSGKENQKARDLSVGEAQRTAIARAVVNNPAVIFADEPTSALDDAHTKVVMDLLFEYAGKTGASLVVSTHDSRIKTRFNNVMEMTL